MNLNLIKAENNLLRARACEPYIVETYSESQGGRNLLGFRVYNPETNSVHEVAPEIRKDEKLPVINCIYQSETIYFASFSGQGGTDIVDIYSHDIRRNRTAKLTSLENSLSHLSSNDVVRIFVLAESMLLIQTEVIEINDTESGKGKIHFYQRLINVDTDEEIIAADPNIVNNGINMIVPVSPTHIMMKTGFSYLEDDRLRKGIEDEALIESVYFGPMTQLISSIGIESENNGFQLLGTAYHEKNIFAPKVSGDYIFFSIVDLEEKKSETVFYNYVTEETLRAHSLDIDEENLDTASVVSNIPFVRRTLPGEIQFINIKMSVLDSTFYDDEYVISVGKVFILNRKKGRHNYIRGYLLPGLELIFEQQGVFKCCCSYGDNYYVYYCN